MGKFVDKFLQILFPTRCIFCGEFTDESAVCEVCWPKIFWISGSVCKVCGEPFRYPISDICDKCENFHHYFDCCRSVFSYDDFSKVPILNFKHKDATYLAATFSQWMYRIGKEILRDADFIVPVPITKRKLMKRFYNQSALLGKRISELSGVPFTPSFLTKPVDTLPQEGLSREARLKNIIGAFKVRLSAEKLINKSTLVIIDDVFTTGATVDECAKTLKQAGANKVNVLTIAKVIEPSWNFKNETY